jgi:hypothetical protein
MKRFLDASLPAKTPPGIEAALRQLARFVVPHKKDAPLLVVRPQWHYNLTYVAVDRELETIFPASLMSTKKGVAWRPLLEDIWKQWRNTELLKLSAEERAQKDQELDRIFPKKMGILSFASLDTPDSLLSPLLAHELGHFIDFTNVPHPLHRSDEVFQTSQGALRSFELSQAASRKMLTSWKFLTVLTDTCMRELLADLLALRMMGLSYFIALAEFLKTLVEDNDGVISDSGYPGMKFRLWLLFDQLKNDAAENNLFGFLKSQCSQGNASARVVSDKILKYLRDWERDFEHYDVPKRFEKTTGAQKEIYFVQQAVWESIPELVKIAKKKISNKRRAVLTPHFFDRFDRLTKRRPPTITAEFKESFPEICSAAWVYQIMHGDTREFHIGTMDARRDEYDTTCRLVMKAIDKIPDQ